MTSRAYAWLLVFLLWFVVLLNYLDRQIVFSVLPLIRADLRLSDVQLGLIGTVFTMVYGLLSPIAGYIGDRWGRRRTVLISLIVWSLVTAATGQVRTYTQLLVVRGLMGISEACYLPAGLAMIADHHDKHSLSLATGLHFSGLYLGLILGGAGGGWMGERYGWRLAFSILGCVGVAYGLVLSLLLRPSPVTALATPRFLQSLRELAGISGFRTLTMVFSVTSIANWIVYAWLPLFLFERFGMSLAKAGFTATFYIQIGGFAGILLGGRLSDRWAKRDRRGRLFAQACGLAAAAPFLFVVAVTGSRILISAALLIFGVGRGLYDCNAMPVLSQIAPSSLRSTGYGIFNFAGCISGGIMIAAAGLLKATLGLSTAFAGAAVLLLISAVILSRLAAGRFELHTSPQTEIATLL